MRRLPLRSLTAAVALLTLLAGCSSSAPSTGGPGSSSGVAPSSRVGLVGTTDDQRGTRVGPTDPKRAISLSISMATASNAEINRALAAIQDPNSPEYHHYLTPEEYAKRFGPSAAALATVERSLSDAGFHVTLPSAGGSLLGAQGTVAQAETFFRVQLSDYRTASGESYYAPDVAPRLPEEWKGAALNVLGLNNRPALHPAGILRATRTNAQQPPPRLLGPVELERAYNIAPLHAAGLSGEGQTIAMPEIDTFKQRDIDYFDRTYGITPYPIEVIKVNGGADKAQQVSETTLDIQVIHAIAPRAKILVYESPADFSSLAKNFNKIVSDNRAKVVSVSLGGCEPAIWEAPDLGRNYFATLNNIFRQAAAQGMSVFVASGDDGAYTCHRNDPNDNELSASLPATNPFVTAVGGTALLVNDNGSYYSEAGWEGPMAGSGSGGGLSVGYLRPDWQTGPGVSNQYSTDARQVPDIAASADPLTGYRIYDSTDGSCSGEDCWVAIGGTSASTPLWASLIILADQRAVASGKPTLGFINPMLYQMGASSTLSAAFHDVTVGGNLYYPSTAGWDYATGWGSPDGDKVVAGLLALQG
ncbi:MAG TPA: S53 family peptidase [Ktedonobacterales bacterium]|jgi:kumamolisin